MTQIQVFEHVNCTRTHTHTPTYRAALRYNTNTQKRHQTQTKHTYTLRGPKHNHSIRHMHSLPAFITHTQITTFNRACVQGHLPPRQPLATSLYTKLGVLIGIFGANEIKFSRISPPGHGEREGGRKGGRERVEWKIESEGRWMERMIGEGGGRRDVPFYHNAHAPLRPRCRFP